MGAHVVPYSRAECDDPGCGWEGDLHLSRFAAAAEASQHDADHANAEAVLHEVEPAPGGGAG